MPALIKIDRVSKIFGEGETKTIALRDISLEIHKGEFVAVMGPSGSGKSTLLHILGFLDSVSEGSYVFEGKDISAYTPDAVARIRNERLGFVFQAFNLLSRTSVLQNVLLPLRYSSVPEQEWHERAISAIKSVDLFHRLNAEPSTLSGGEKQRAAIARALVNNPSVIFADEPTGNLDSKSGQIVMEIIRRLNDEGHTVILITHETYTAENAKRIIRLKDGVIESDTQVAQRASLEKFSK
ncbi:MAG: macrolide ABC transporter ATP-binding protein [Candidatus Taylorbacteria bacterium RIFCSPHIGHO2_01_FULL_46_22b]|uniref:Macrolide ABC transporter ATP-binding protein n=1 Tax=Candidatus Taylorbacteria bacterium RIFCSPHIGHO2_01_FULL_46_22b TaxID=1802301 RepID=A0A1G2M6N0_9BACT|nr:MAG: macrolide ABC transporter ATP-binding protein [Candidatus Taylorbacteria bacterium RIFCSPHIGHO2_01_FULL_46_22b]